MMIDLCLFLSVILMRQECDKIMQESFVDDTKLIEQLAYADRLNGVTLRDIGKKYGRDKDWALRVVRRLGTTNATDDTEIKVNLEKALVENTIALTENRVYENVEFKERLKNSMEEGQEFIGLRSGLGRDIRNVEKISKRLDRVANAATRKFNEMEVDDQAKFFDKFMNINLAAQRAARLSAMVKVELVKSRIAPIESNDNRQVNITINRKSK